MRGWLVVGGFLLFTAPALAQEHGVPLGKQDAKSPEVLSVASRLACDCGCPHLSISWCPCGTAQKYRLEIDALLAGGLEGDAAYTAMLEKYGTTLLAEPPDTGMGIFAKRVLPVLLAVFGLGIVGLVIFRLRARPGDKADDDAADSDSGDGGDDKYLERVEKELEKY